MPDKRWSLVVERGCRTAAGPHFLVIERASCGRSYLPRPAALPIEPATDVPTAWTVRTLGDLRTLQGFIGCILFDARLGLSLGTLGDEPQLLASAVHHADAYGAQLRAAQRLTGVALDDMVTSYKRQVHFVRPLDHGSARFLLLVLDRSRANLGFARVAMGEVQASLREVFRGT